MEAFDFADQVVLLTGATGGLGREITQILVDQGAFLVVTGRRRSALDALVETVAKGDRVMPLYGDLTQPGEATRLAKSALAVHNRVDVLINNAGMGYFALIEEATEERIRQLFEVNTFAPMMLIKALLPHFYKRGRGRIVNVASSAGRVPIPTVGVYGSSKSALAMLANTLRIEVMDRGIEVINIYPGTTDTAFEANALREKGRDGIRPSASFGADAGEIAGRIVKAAKGTGREVWLERQGRGMSVAALLWPKLVDRRLAGLRQRVLVHTRPLKPARDRRWQLLQVESALSCNLKCIMCPWTALRASTDATALMSEQIWQAIVPHLPEVASVDFSGAGEPLLNPHLPDWMAQAKSVGCKAGFLTNGTLLDDVRAQAVLEAGVDWIGVSVDGASARTYESIRSGASFARVTDNISRLVALRSGGVPKVLINFVMLRQNAHELQNMVLVAEQLGVDHISFKQCDVIRDKQGLGLGLFQPQESQAIKQLRKEIKKSQRLARKKKIETTFFSLVPEEQPVCDQDPRASLFIRSDGLVAPCINKAYGGATTFLGEPTEMPTVWFGQLPQNDLSDIWRTDNCRFYQTRFDDRMRHFSNALMNTDFDFSMGGVQDVLDEAQEAMNAPPKGCDVCHYLYDI